jgi:hypothetical protein
MDTRIFVRNQVGIKTGCTKDVPSSVSGSPPPRRGKPTQYFSKNGSGGSFPHAVAEALEALRFPIVAKCEADEACAETYRGWLAGAAETPFGG